VILPPFRDPALSFPAEFDCEGLAVVGVGHSHNIEGIHRVVHPHYRIAYMLTRFLLSRGYRNIGLHLSHEMNDRTGRKYPGGFWAALGESPDAVFSKEQVLFSEDHPDGFLDWVSGLKLDAVISQYPDNLPTLREAGFAVPGDLGFGLLSLNESDPSLTGCYHDPEVLATAAVDLVTAHIHRNETGKPSSPKTISTPPILVEGTTV
jgi:DNA-binding LacI/PurR family transcriptional regulator